MAIIYSYPDNTNILLTDLLIGTSTVRIAGKKKNLTKNFTVEALSIFLNNQNPIAWGNISGNIENQTDLWNALESKQGNITLTTIGSSGASTLIGDILNIPNYSASVIVPTLDEVLTEGNTSDKSIILNHIPEFGEINPLPWISTLNGRSLDIDWSSTVNDNYYSSSYRGNTISLTGYESSTDKESAITLDYWSIRNTNDSNDLRTTIYPSAIINQNSAQGRYSSFDVNQIIFNVPSYSGAIRISNITSNIVLEFPNKLAGTYTIATTDDINGFVPYTGADTNVNLGLFDITAQHLIKNGGISSQFLKADGSVDNNIYLTSADLPSTLDLFATTTSDPLIPGYVVLVRNILDPRYNTVAVNVPTGVITTTNQLVGQLITDTNVISGNPGVFNFTTVGNIQRINGTGQAEFYFRIYKRDSLGIETFITQSNNTLPVLNTGYAEFSAVALWNDGTFLSTDRIVLKYYGSRIPTGSDPSFQFQFGGLTPVRSTAAVPVAVLPNIYLSNLVDVEDVVPLPNEVLYWNETANLWEHSSVLDLMPEATPVTDGYLSSTDFNTFNEKAIQNTELTIRRRQYTYYNEFFSSISNGTYAAATVATGTAVSATAAFNPNHYGIVGFQSSATANSGFYSALNPSAAVHFGITVDSESQSDLVFKTPVTIAGTSVIRFGLGAGSITSVEYTNGAYFEILGNTLVGKTARASVRSSTASYVLSADTWYHLRVHCAGIDIYYYVYDMDGLLLFSATLTTNIPLITTVMNQSVIATNSGTAVTILGYFDLISLTVYGAVRGALD